MGGCAWRAGWNRRVSQLSVFDARFYVRVRRIDEPAKRCGVGRHSRSQLHMTHALAGSLQQTGGVPQRCTLKESHIHVRSEYIDVSEGHIAQARNRTAVMQELADLVPAISHHLKPA